MIEKNDNIQLKATIILLVWVVLAFLAIAWLFGCTTTRTKNTDTQESDSTAKSTSSTHVDTKTLTEEIGTVKTTEILDTNLIIPESKIKGVTNDGLFENQDIMIKAKVNERGNIDLEATTKEKIISVRKKRTTESNSKSSKNETVSKKEATENEADVSKKTVSVQATKVTKWYSPSWWWLLLLLIPAIGYSAYKIWKPIKL